MAHLDRLSALLAGLAPKIRLHDHELSPDTGRLADLPDDGLQLQLLLDGALELVWHDTSTEVLKGPALLVWRGNQLSALKPTAAAGEHRRLGLQALFEGPAAALLLEAFAQPLSIRLDERCAELDLVVRLIAEEMAAQRCGQSAMLARAGEILFIGLLRHLVANPRMPSGMLSGLAEPRIARVLVAIHEQPVAGWTLAELAEVAGMSRTAFALRFHALMNVAPGSYLTRLRLAIARREIALGNGLKRAARKSGYASSTALSRALSRQAAGLGKVSV